jgi:hypothetical protein
MRTRTIAACAVALAALAGAAGCSSGEVRHAADGAHKAADKAAQPLSMFMEQVAHTTDAEQSAQISVSTRLSGMSVRMDGTYAQGSHPGMTWKSGWTRPNSACGSSTPRSGWRS